MGCCAISKGLDERHADDLFGHVHDSCDPICRNGFVEIYRRLDLCEGANTHSFPVFA